MPFATVKRKRSFLGIYVPEWLVLALLPVLAGISDYAKEPLRRPVSLYLERLASGIALYLVALLVSLLIVRLVHLRMGRAKKTFVPHQATLSEFRRLFLQRKSLLLDLRLLQLTCLFFVLFINLKHFVPSVNPFLADKFLFRFDESIGRGRSVTELVISAVGVNLADTISSGYFLFYPYVAILVYLFLMLRHDELKLEFFTGFFLVWIVGIAFVYLIPSYGPCFYAPDTIAALPETGVSAMQQRLWLHKTLLDKNSLDPRAIFLISGFPSLHLAVPVYGSLMLHRVKHWIAVLSWMFCVLTAITTLYFGWHYLLDDVAAIAIGVLIYRQTRRYFQTLYVYVPEKTPDATEGAREGILAMRLTRSFIGFERNILHAVADVLLKKSPNFDLSHVAVVLSGGRAQRRLLEILVDAAGNANKLLFPPKLITRRGLLDVVERPSSKRPVSEFDKIFYLAETLQNLDEVILTPVLPRPPKDNFEWFRTARVLSALDTEVSGGLLSYQEIAERGEQLSLFSQTSRWLTLQHVFERYDELLNGHNLIDPLRAISSYTGALRGGISEIIFGGISQLSKAEKALIRRYDVDVTVVINAPEKLALCYDELGTVIPKATLESKFEVADENLLIVDSVRDQGKALLSAIAEMGPVQADAITVGSNSSSITPYLHESMRSVGLNLRDGAGIPFFSTELGVLLSQLRQTVDLPTVSNVGAFLRHPGIERRIGRSVSNALDEYQMMHMQGRLTSEIFGASAEADELRTAITPLIKALANIQEGRRTFGEWSEHLLEMIRTTLGDVEYSAADDAGRQMISGLESVVEVLAQARHIQSERAIDGRSAIGILGESLRGVHMPHRADPKAVDLVGWLELAADDAPNVIVTGMNEGNVPEGRSGELFLPNSLRSLLDIETEDSRLARDLLNTQVILHSKKHVRFILSRRDDDGAMLQPSRVMLWGDDKTLVERIKVFYSMHEKAAAMSEGGTYTKIFPTKAYKHRTITNLTASQINTYLEDPYLFYLRYVSMPSGEERSSR